MDNLTLIFLGPWNCSRYRRTRQSQPHGSFAFGSDDVETYGT